MTSRHWKIFWPVFWSLLAASGLIVLCCYDETAREVAWETTRTVLGILCTPFILETTSIIVGICILMGIRHYQDKREGDGWVYLATQEPEDKTLPRALTERLQSVVLTEKPSEPDDNASRRAVIEGYLELGMAAQALADLNSDAAQDDLESTLLRSRVLASNLETEAALLAIRDAETKFPDSKKDIAASALETSSWIGRHLQQPDLVKTWRTEAERILQASIIH